MTYGQEVRDNLSGPARELRRAIPDVYAGFGRLHDAALADGALSTRTKELIALALSVAEGCDGCIAAHAHAAVFRPPDVARSRSASPPPAACCARRSSRPGRRAGWRCP